MRSPVKSHISRKSAERENQRGTVKILQLKGKTVVEHVQGKERRKERRISLLVDGGKEGVYTSRVG